MLGRVGEVDAAGQYGDGSGRHRRGMGGGIDAAGQPRGDHPSRLT
jgi:hypothetical protein